MKYVITSFFFNYYRCSGVRVDVLIGV